MATVTRYVVTHLNRDGVRTLAHSMQGRCTYETAAEAEQWIKDAVSANGHKLGEFYGLPLQVHAVECYPGHFDPTTCWFD